MKVSALGLTIFKHYEGKDDKPILTAYVCPAGKLTIGFGTTHYPNNQAVRAGDTCTAAQAETYLQHDIAVAETQVWGLFSSCYLTQNQFDALVSFAHNCGAGNLATSSLFAYIHAGGRDPKQISDGFCKYHFAAGKELNGLLFRRSTEAYLFNTGQVKFFNL